MEGAAFFPEPEPSKWGDSATLVLGIDVAACHSPGVVRAVLGDLEKFSKSVVIRMDKVVDLNRVQLSASHFQSPNQVDIISLHRLIRSHLLYFFYQPMLYFFQVFFECL